MYCNLFIRFSLFLSVSLENALDEISLANHSQFLLLSIGSLRRLAHQLIEKGVASYLIPSWEDTLALEGHHQHIEKEQEDQEQQNSLLEHQVSTEQKSLIFLSDFSDDVTPDPGLFQWFFLVLVVSEKNYHHVRDLQ